MPARWTWSTTCFSAGVRVLRRGEVWRIEGARERLGLVISSDVYNSTDVPIVIVAEVVEQALLRDSPLAVPMGGYVVMPDRVSSPMKKWFTECVDVADTDTMLRVGRALRIIQQI
ncbi:type II toxin-antitoxin system PemK/MazF family toxin [Micromonospora costi]|uniref:type II toxin-antitoxin system PemK/MazF family toxin n=1 Tax=Micromonospora costi TaxID=1530042 RepID=UPI00157565D1|nr:type II toxin-antitoxin system PemK/MazF family toxin [Micromonospora costi]